MYILTTIIVQDTIEQVTFVWSWNWSLTSKPTKVSCIHPLMCINKFRTTQIIFNSNFTHSIFMKLPNCERAHSSVTEWFSQTHRTPDSSIYIGKWETLKSGRYSRIARWTGSIYHKRLYNAAWPGTHCLPWPSVITNGFRDQIKKSAAELEWGITVKSSFITHHNSTCQRNFSLIHLQCHESIYGMHYGTLGHLTNQDMNFSSPWTRGVLECNQRKLCYTLWPCIYMYTVAL